MSGSVGLATTAMTDVTQIDTTDATLTEYLPAAENADPSIDGAAKISHIKVGHVWQTDDAEAVDSITRYGVKCSCGEAFDTWGAATAHAEGDH